MYRRSTDGRNGCTNIQIVSLKMTRMPFNEMKNSAKVAGFAHFCAVFCVNNSSTSNMLCEGSSEGCHFFGWQWLKGAEEPKIVHGL
jgi:hypothetical protein